MENTTITKAKPKDCENLLKLISKEFSYKKFDEKSLKERITNPKIIIFKITKDKKFIGFIDLDLKEKEPLISAIAIVPTQRKKGFGKKLMKFALKFLIEQGYRNAKLLVSTENIQAKKLYSKIGFSFAKFHEKQIEGKTIEVWEKKL
ncbi:MAG: GNAT family N-acetyltransferase [Candidatus Diapherotrites archaeon]